MQQPLCAYIYDWRQKGVHLDAHLGLSCPTKWNDSINSINLHSALPSGGNLVSFKGVAVWRKPRPSFLQTPTPLRETKFPWKVWGFEGNRGQVSFKPPPLWRKHNFIAWKGNAGLSSLSRLSNSNNSINSINSINWAGRGDGTRYSLHPDDGRITNGSETEFASQTIPRLRS